MVIKASLTYSYRYTQSNWLIMLIDKGAKADHVELSGKEFSTTEVFLMNSFLLLNKAETLPPLVTSQV